jgi:hypothetical protein
VQLLAPQQTDPNADFWAHRNAYPEELNSAAESYAYKQKGNIYNTPYSAQRHIEFQLGLPSGELSLPKATDFSQIEHYINQREAEQERMKVVPGKQGLSPADLAAKMRAIPSNRTWIQELWEGSKIQVERAAEYVKETLMPPPEKNYNVGQGLSRAANILFGNPFGGQLPADTPARGVYFTFGFQGLSSAVRRTIGLIHNLGIMTSPAPVINMPVGAPITEPWDATDPALSFLKRTFVSPQGHKTMHELIGDTFQLEKGTFGTHQQEFVQQILGVSDDDILAETQQAFAMQQEWDRRSEELKSQGMNRDQIFSVIFDEYRFGKAGFAQFTDPGFRKDQLKIQRNFQYFNVQP